MQNKYYFGTISSNTCETEKEKLLESNRYCAFIFPSLRYSILAMKRGAEMSLPNINNSDVIVEQLVHKTNEKSFKQFIHLIYSNLPPEELSVFDIDYLFKAASSAFRLLHNRKEHEIKSHIYKPDKETDQIILEVINNDMPFVVDSIINQLKLEDFDITLISHQTASVLRDATGNFVRFTTEEKAYKESIIQFHLSKWCGEEYLIAFYHKIQQVLECVNLAVADWKGMSQKMEEAKELVEKHNFHHNTKLQEENIKFLNWLIEGNFVFLGWYESKVLNSSVLPIKKDVKGVLRSKAHNLEEAHLDAQYQSDDVICIKKWDECSLVHRPSHMDHVVIKKFDRHNKCIGSMDFLGFFTSSVYYQSVRNIPLIREKINHVIEKYGYPEYSHNCKELVTALENFPRSELIQMHEEEILETAKGIVSLELIPKVKIFIREDASKKFIHCLIFIPKARFSNAVRDTIEKMLCSVFNAVISNHYVKISESQLASLRILLKTEPSNSNDSVNYDIAAIEQGIIKEISIWDDHLAYALKEHYSHKEAKTKHAIYKNAFNIKYTSSFSAQEAVYDIGVIEEALQDNTVKFYLYYAKDAENLGIQLKIFSPDDELPISSTLPILEHLGFFAIDVLTFKTTIKDLGTVREIYIHHFRLKPKLQGFELTDNAKSNIEEACNKIWSQAIEDDRFNSLIVYSNITCKQANLLRVYSKYLKQINFQFSADYIIDALVNNSNITHLLIQLFELKFDPRYVHTEGDMIQLIFQIHHALSMVKNIAEDKVIRAYLNIIESTKRTNYFQNYSDGQEKEYLSLKIASSEVIDIPLPKPYAEIFVCSSRVEAVHLRGGKVARGGLRWSDRSEDFRTEVLGLMKAQMTKNAVIVPVGSKGGFVLKKTTPQMTREEIFQEAVDCYKIFLSGLLDITDNIIENNVIPPENVVRYDEDDPYLVVAADKGTATFSDYANEISAKYKFWLGDAFASGGSAGYDHKKLAITSKGGWIAVQRHFREIGLDIERELFTVMGIGDMSGDVFGNGMLLSQNIKLVAAFNNLYIFLDPTPNPKISYDERLRLFKLPRSQWTDYDLTLISQGGGVFSRSEKVIKLTPEMKKLLDRHEDELSPDALLKAILQMPVDLLWSGGIGTYVKSSTQTNEMIGDKANDNLRVNAQDLRCKVVGEGGNLGFTQLGRIEYASRGGKINTDFIDNSGGVDCSDHEVNVKIAFAEALHNQQITMDKRNSILDKMRDEICHLVLQDNMKQTQIMSIEEEDGNRRLEQHAWLIKRLEFRHELDREIEFLPSNEKISTLKAEGGKLTRPEIAILMAYAKNSVAKMLVNNDFLRDKFFHNDLLSYFPTIIRTEFQDLALNHKLKNQIIATLMTNDFINMLGCCYFHQLTDDLGYKPQDIIKAFVVVREIFGITKHWKELENLSNNIPQPIKIMLFHEIQNLLTRNINWFLRHHHTLNDVGAMVAKYRQGVEDILLNYKTLMPNTLIEEIHNFSNLLESHGLNRNLIDTFAAFRAVISACDIVVVADNLEENILKVATTFYMLGETMHLNWMLSQAKKCVSNQYVENIALRLIISEIEDIQMGLTAKEVQFKKEVCLTLTEEIEASCLVKTEHREQYNNFIAELKASSSDAWLSLLTIALKRVKGLMHG